MWTWITNKFAKFHAKRVNRSENIPISFRGGGLLFFETPCSAKVYSWIRASTCLSVWPMPMRCHYWPCRLTIVPMHRYEIKTKATRRQKPEASCQSEQLRCHQHQGHHWRPASVQTQTTKLTAAACPAGSWCCLTTLLTERSLWSQYDSSPTAEPTHTLVCHC